MSLREEFARLALSDGSNMTMLCKRYEISRKTATFRFSRALTTYGRTTYGTGARC